MRSIKNKLEYSCIIGISAIALSLLTINTSYSNETKCVIEKNGKIVYNTESSKSDCSSSIFELYNKFENTNKAKNNGNIDTKVLGLDDIKNNQDSSGESGGGKTIAGDDLNNEIIPSEDLQEDTDTQCGVPVWKDKTVDGDIYKILSISGDTYTNIKSLNNIPTELSNTSSTFTATCADGYSTEVDGVSSNIITFTCTKKDDNSKPTWVSNASQCYKLATLSKCWSASGGKTPNDNNDTTINNSYQGYIDTDCCNSDKGLYVDLDLKLKRALCESTNESAKYGCEKDETNNTYSINEKIYDENWKTRLKEEKLIKYISLSGSEVDLRCLNLSGLNMQQTAKDAHEDIKSMTDVKATNAKGEKDTSSNKLIHKFNTVIKSKTLLFSLGPRPRDENSTLNDGSNLKNSNFSSAVFNSVNFGTCNGDRSGNPGSNLTNANFSNSQFNTFAEFGYNYDSSGNPGSNLTNANFSNSVFGYSVHFGYNYNGSTGNPGSNLTNANFSGSSFSNYIIFGYNEDNSSGNPGSNLTNANFSHSNFGSFIFFGDNQKSTGNPGSNLTNANFSGSNFTNIFFGHNVYSSGNPGSNLTNANFSNSSFSTIFFGSNLFSSGNPGSNLTNANFSGSSFSWSVYFGYNDNNSSGNPGSNLNNAIFESTSFTGDVFEANNTNTCKVKSFDTTEKLSKECSTEVDGNVDNNVYNPYCALNPDNCCIKSKNTGTVDSPVWECEGYGWNGTH